LAEVKDAGDRLAVDVTPAPDRARVQAVLWGSRFLATMACSLAFGAWLERLGGGAEHATDPVCGMQVGKGAAPASTVVDGERFYFCSDRCRERFESSPV